MRLSDHPEAEAEVVQASEFYEARSPGLGVRFLDRFDAAIAAVTAAPQLWPIIDGELRCKTLDGFPFGVITDGMAMSCASSS